MTNMLKVGTPVRVSDGSPKPPAHHTKKLREWKCWNFEGRVHEIDQRFGAVLVERKPYNDHARILVHARPHHLTAIIQEED